MQAGASGNAPTQSAARLTEQDLDSKTFIEGALESGTAGKQLSVADKVGKYQIRGLLGEGGMGAVYLAWDPLIEREVALKVLTQDAGDSSIALQRFLGEARSIGRLNHPNVVSIYDIDQWQGRYYIVMELLSGGSVAGLQSSQGALAWEHACDLVAQAARGLAAAHLAGMIHRDVKPENLMLTRDGVVKVVDFGLSKLLDASDDSHAAVTKAGQILGTPQYMSPEQFEAEQVDARTDIYSLGATLFRLLTAHFPYHDCRSILQVMTAHLSKPAPVPTALVSTVPVECNEIVARAMAKNPADRYQTATELADVLEALIQTKKQGQPTAKESRQTSERHFLDKVIIVEPSRLQAAVFKNAVLRTGANSIEVLQTVESANRVIEREAADLVITAMQLPDGRGIDLLKELCQRSLLDHTTVVLNSSDSTLDELVAVGTTACHILASKKVRPEDVLGLVHGAGSCPVQDGPLAVVVDPSSLRIHIELDAGRIPEAMANILRELLLLNVEVTMTGESVDFGDQQPHISLLVRTGVANAGEEISRLAAISNRPGSSSLMAVVQWDKGELSLRAVYYRGASAVCRCVLDAARMVRLLQACRF
jgi:serine/threonine protein kinase